MKDNRVTFKDKNMLESTAEWENLVWYPVTHPAFQMTGAFAYEPGVGFLRVPAEVAENSNEGVVVNNRHTAGVHVRFRTNAAKIGVRAVYPYVQHFTHMPITGTSGFDLYADSADGKTSAFLSVIRPTFDFNCAEPFVGAFQTSGKDQCYTINFPLYNALKFVEIGLPKDATLSEGAPYALPLPVVYYGSSITQGGCAGRPGVSYEARISRKYNINQINLGFSGHAKAEQAIMDYMATIPMAAFVYDYDHNASVSRLSESHEPGFLTVRKANPDLPIVFVTRPDGRRTPEESKRRFDIIHQTYENAWASGDRNVYFVDGFRFYEGDHPEDCSVDGIHPNDEGLSRMAEVIGDTLKTALKL